MNNKIKIVLSVIMLIFMANSNFAQVKLAQSGMKFLRIGETVIKILSRMIIIIGIIVLNSQLQMLTNLPCPDK